MNNEETGKHIRPLFETTTNTTINPKSMSGYQNYELTQGMAYGPGDRQLTTK
jgi:hypothetical protein